MSSCYAKILGETKFQPREFLRCGLKAKDGKERNIYLLVMLIYWGKQIFSLGSFPLVVQKQKTEKKERPKVGNNNGHLRIGNATSGGACKPPGPILLKNIFVIKCFGINPQLIHIKHTG